MSKRQRKGSGSISVNHGHTCGVCVAMSRIRRPSKGRNRTRRNITVEQE